MNAEEQAFSILQECFEEADARMVREIRKSNDPIERLKSLDRLDALAHLAKELKITLEDRING